MTSLPSFADSAPAEMREKEASSHADGVLDLAPSLAASAPPCATTSTTNLEEKEEEMAPPVDMMMGKDREKMVGVEEWRWW